MYAIFPASSVDSSILTSVLVGLLVVWALQELLGWNFTGLVVPGYLASILVIQPEAGLVVALEAVICWGAFVLISERATRWLPWTPLFGRDRFLFFLLLSVLVRIVLEAGGFAYLTEQLGLAVDEDLHSMGLVVVPLAANALWRSGPTRTMFRFAVPVAITWALLDRVLLPYTNLSLSSFELTYEDLALDFVSSPRAYILLLFGAWLGSAANHRWGWDYGGIIVPGLLSICWPQPVRVVATMGEAVVIAGLYLSVIRLPWLRTVNLTGGRPMVLAFALGYLLKFILAWTLGDRWPGFAVRDVFGFGFLLSTILALRIVKHKDVFRSVIPALSVSLFAYVAGSGASFALATLLPPPQPPHEHEVPVAEEAQEQLVRAAWRNSGNVPRQLSRVLQRRQATILTGGEGFGGLWVREQGSELAVIGAVGADSEGLAALGVGLALDARVILLCAEGASEPCRLAERQIARVLPVLRVRQGASSVLSVAGQMPAGLDSGRLGALVGSFTLESGQGRATLTLDRVALARAADSAIGEPPSEALNRASEPPPEDPLAPRPDRAARRRFYTDVARAIQTWARSAPEGEAMLRVAAGSARALGLTLAREGERITLSGSSWTSTLDRGVEGPLVYVPDARADTESLDLARTLAGALPASLLVIDAPTAEREDVSTRDRYPSILTLAAIAELGENAQVITVRSVPRTRDPGADMILAAGPPLPPGSPLPDPARGLHDLLLATGYSVIVQDGAAQRMNLSDNGNPVASAVRLATGQESHVALFAAARAVRHFSRANPTPPALEAARAAGLSETAWDLNTMAGWVLGEVTDADQRASADVGRVRAFLAAPRAAALAPLRRSLAQDGGELHLVCDPALGCRWLAAERCEALQCEGVLVPIARQNADVRAATPPDRRLPLAPLPALAFDAADLSYRRPQVTP